MDHRPNDALNDATIEREIEAVLAVEPSPEFLARVRMHIAKEPSRSAWRVLPRLWSVEPLLALGVFGIVLSIVIPSWLRPEPPAVVEQPVEQPVASTSPAPAPQQRALAEPARLHPSAAAGVIVRRGRPSGRPVVGVPPFPEVLVSANEQRALALLLTKVEQGRLPPLPVASGSGQLESTERPALEIPDLVIEPLPQIAQLAIGERP